MSKSKRKPVDAAAVLGLEEEPGPVPDGPVHLTELGNARRVVRARGLDIRICKQLPSRWLVWTDGRWMQDEKGEVARLVKRVPEWIVAQSEEVAADSRRLLEEDPDGNKVVAGLLKKKAEAMRAWASRSESSGAVSSTLKLLETESIIPVQIEELDRHPWLLGTLTLTVDLKAGTYRYPRREDYLTKQTGVPFDPGATAPRWEQFLLEVMKGDEEMVSFLQRSVGYTLIGKQLERVMFVCHGDGANGKSVFLKVIRRMMGDYSRTVPAESFVGRKDGSIPNDIAMLAGARFVSFTESKENAVLEEGLVKQVTGGDPISARFLNREFFEFDPQFTLWMATNHKPRIRGGDHGIWSRIRLVPFERKFTEKEQDLELMDKLVSEEAGILNWALAGLRMWHERGLDPPVRVIEATDQYRKDQNIVVEFLDQCCTLREGAVVTSTDLYTRFAEWSRAMGELPRSQRWFSGELGKLGYDRDRTSAQRLWRGVELMDAPKNVTSWRSRVD